MSGCTPDGVVKMKIRFWRMIIAVILCLALVVPSMADRVVLPSDITEIDDEAFFGDQSLTELELPEGLLRIGSKAFAETSLRSVTLPRSLQYFAEDSFDFSDEDFEVYVYSGSKAEELCSEYGLHPTVIVLDKVGISMPTKDLQRWNQDGENMEKMLQEAGYDVELQFASNDVPTQLAQIEAMIDNGAEVVVIAAIEGSSLGQVLDKAAEKGCKVIAYDRLLLDNENVDYYVTFDNYEVGTIQGTYVKEKLNLDKAEGPFYLEFTAGDPGDNNAGFYFNGAIDVLKPYIDAGKVIVRSGQTEFIDVATLYWKPEFAQKRAEDILSSKYADDRKLDAWVCSNDTTAYGVTNALEGCYDFESLGWPIITGQDCDKANVRNMMDGKQSMSVFKDTRILVARVVKMIDRIMKGEKVEVNDTETYDNNIKVVPTYLCSPIVIEKSNVNTLIDMGYYTEDDLK